MSQPIKSRSRLPRLSAMTLACLGTASAVLAQEADKPAQPLPSRIEITGSRLEQIDTEGASPVQVIKREDIVKTGATSVREFLDTLAVTSSGSINDANGSGTFSPGASQASLRNLGAQSTLLLLNGRRLSTFPLPNFQETFSNLDSIPFDIVDRVEILKIGGSAVYGSDAIAGVINIITKASFEGLAVGASTQASAKSGRFGERSAYVSGGLGDYDRDGYNVFGNVEFFRRDPLMWGRVLSQANPAYAALSPSFGTPSTYSSPGNIDGVAIPGCTGQVTGTTCFYDRYSRIEAVPKTQRLNATLKSDVRLHGDTDWHSEFLLSSIHAEYQNGYATYGSTFSPDQWLDTRTGLQNTFHYRSLPTTNPLIGPNGNPDNDFRYRFTDADSSERTDSTEYRFLTGLKGSFRSWDYDSAVGVMGGHTTDRLRGQFSLNGFTKEIGDPGHVDPATGELTPVSADFFDVPGGYAIGGHNSAGVLDALFPKYGFDGTYRQFFVDAGMTGDVLQLPAGSMSLALGADAHHETMVLTPTRNVIDDDIIGFAQAQSDGSRNFGAVYGELGIPILKTLKAGLAGRVDKFQGVGVHFSPRANFEFRPADTLLLRGTVETGFRAPNLQESAQSSKSAYQTGISDPQRCPAATAIANDLRAQAANDGDPAEAALLLDRAEQIQGNECSAGVNIIARNNPDLRPERSLSKSLGAVFQMTQHWSASVDWWSITRKNEINLKSVQNLLTAESSNADVITRTSGGVDPSFTSDQIAQYGITAGPLASVRLQYGNLFETRTSGFDFGVKGEVALPIGRLTSALEGTYTANWQTYSPSRDTTGGWGDNLAGRYGFPRWQFNLTNTLQAGDFSHTIRWAHASGTSLQGDFDDTTWNVDGCVAQGLSAGQCHLGAYNRFDYALEYTGFKRLTIGGNLINVFNHRPPMDVRAFGGASGIAPSSAEDAQGTLVKVYFSYKFF
jgi:iron complex outermembrane receptor protein